METSISSMYTMYQQFCFLLSVHCHQYSQELHKEGINIPVTQIEKVRLRNVKYLAPDQLEGCMNLHALKVLSNASFYVKYKHCSFIITCTTAVTLQAVNFFVHSLI